MKKEKTVVVTACDFCTRHPELPTWVCARCNKDACAECGRDWTIYAARPRTFNNSVSISTDIFSPPQPKYSAFFCNDCGENAVSAPLLRVGFNEGDRREVKVAGSLFG